ncbi:MAG: NUDIX domain-containing protein [Candidatus Falkowbacteria bacterium]
MLDNLIDVLDKEGKKTGQVLTSLDVHEQGLWHATVHIWVYNSKGEILLQKRSEVAVTYPGLWDISAAGHIDAGETPVEAAIREIKEEIGIAIKKKDLKSAFIRKSSVKIPVRGWMNKEFQHVYTLRLNKNLKDLKLQTDEVGKVKFFSIDDFTKKLNDPEEYKKFVQHGEYYFEIIEFIKDIKN